ncbi:zinc-ribbon domain-containing protein [Desulfovibrio sp. OttesenSCG-928-G11]|nr:zinc-ribbon domain-containing protein [Desulfovibrio sp. OttesenSCG-928-G11]
MFIACPKCETTFSLPDDLYKPGKKARCSQCGTVFPMPDKPDPDLDPLPGIGESAAPLPGSKKKRKIDLKIPLIAAAALVLLLLLIYGGWLMFGPDGEETAAPDAQSGEQNGEATPPASQDAAREALINGIALDEIRQFLVENAVIGKIMVIQGQAINQSQGPRDYISIEARILDAKNRVLAQTSQVCGVSLTLFQLQSLSAAEIKESLDNRITILTNNTNTPPGGKVPFVVVFPNPPEGMRTFEVRVIDVRESPPQ